MRKTILIITLGLLLLLSSCDNTTASGGVSLPDWMYSTEARTEAELKDALKGTSEDKEIIVSVPAGTTIEVKDTIDVSGKNVKLIISDKAEIKSTKTIFSIPAKSTMTIEGQGTLDAGSQAAITSAGTLFIKDASLEGTANVLAVTGGTTTISGGSFVTTGKDIATVSGNGTISIPESSQAVFTVGTSGTVFGSATGLDIKGGTYNVKLSADLCAIGYMAQPTSEDSKEYKVKWSDAKIVADIINGLSQEKIQNDLSSILSVLTNPGGVEGTGSGTGTDEGAQPGTDTSTTSVTPSVTDGSLTITGTAPPFKLTFKDYNNGFKDPDFATVVSGTATLDITIPTTTTTIPSTLDYAITCADVTVEIDGHTVVINLAESKGKVEVGQSGTDSQLLIKYPTVGEGALKVKSDNGSQNTVVWADVDDLLDDQASILPSTSTGSGTTGN